jgi:hypothetical protein
MFDKVTGGSFILGIKVTSTRVLTSARSAFELMAAAAFHRGDFRDRFKKRVNC